jgi:hypothetical protein
MSALKFLTVLTTGATRLVSAITTSLGSGDANKIIATDSNGKIHSSFMPTGVEIQVETAIATEDLTDGNFVNIYDNGGTPSVRKGIANDVNKLVKGFVLANFLIGDTVTIYTKGVNTSITADVDAVYFLSATTAGLATTTAPAQTVGNFQQTLGVGVPSGVLFEFDAPIYFG